MEANEKYNLCELVSPDSGMQGFATRLMQRITEEQ
jgi:hypothetical protein